MWTSWGLSPWRGAEADLPPPGLEVAAVAAGADLPERVLPGQPDLDVVGLGRGEAHVPGAEEHHPVVQPQPAEDLGGVVHHPLQRLHAAAPGG